jgi:hypothetical protein
MMPESDPKRGADEAISDRGFVSLGLTYPSPLAKIYDFSTID